MVATPLASVVDVAAVTEPEVVLQPTVTPGTIAPLTSVILTVSGNASLVPTSVGGWPSPDTMSMFAGVRAFGPDVSPHAAIWTTTAATGSADKSEDSRVLPVRRSQPMCARAAPRGLPLKYQRAHNVACGPFPAELRLTCLKNAGQHHGAHCRPTPISFTTRYA